MSLKLLLIALEQARLEYARTRSPHDLQRVLKLIARMRAKLNEIEGSLLTDDESDGGERAW